MKKVLVGCAIAAGIGVILLVVGGIWILKQPESGVKLGNQMDRYALDYLDRHKILTPTEQVVAYYDCTMAMDGTEAAILTTRRVLYHKDGRTEAIDLTDVKDVKHRKESLTGDIIEIYATSGKSMKIEIAPLNEGETFRSSLMNAWTAAKGGSSAESKGAPAEETAPGK